ncbi:MAG TPA: RHS repeat-associated core domain-containing protein [Gemmatimonadaceae bacterium]|nr:RHS repeat-associated core domain-containing protein [Gemmatimonadaceae bacterium]
MKNHAEASGIQYLRNRYFDPRTGRFTQEDPIGLAGGLNLYGFAGGDPVSFSDPFGLCPPEDTNVQDCPSVLYWRERTANSESIFGTIGNHLMAGFAAVGETAIAELQGYAVGPCGETVSCGIAPDISPGGAKHLLPGVGKGWTTLRGSQGWRDAVGNIWKKDRKHSGESSARSSTL